MSMDALVLWRRQLSRVYRGAQAAMREWSGDADYERYVNRCARLRQTPLERGRFLAQRLEQQYRMRGHCC